MKPIKFITLPLLLVAISLISMTCKEKEKEPEITYYDVTGVGYAFMYDEAGNILRPIGVRVEVVSKIQWRETSFTTSSPEEIFTSDATGKYQVRFIKRYKGDDVDGGYSLFTFYREWRSHFTFSVDKVKNAQSIIELDTFKMYINEIKY
jgi:hypothetical protein